MHTSRGAMAIEKINNHYVPLSYDKFPSFFCSPTRDKIVKLMDSDGGVVSNEVFLLLKTKFCCHPEGLSRFVQLKQSVTERNLEIRNKGILRIVCHIVAVWLRQSITAQAERLISQIALENPSLYRLSINNVAFDDKLKSANAKEKNNIETIKKEEIPELMQAIDQGTVVAQHLLKDIRLENKSKLLEMDEVFKEKFKEKSHVSRLIKEAEQKKLVVIKEKAAKFINVTEGNEPKVKKSRVSLPEGEYQGEINENNFPHGKGRLHCPNGEVFEGDFEDGKFMRGTQETSLGSILEGEKFVEFRLEGPGTYKKPNGEKYQGNFIFGNLDFRSITYEGDKGISFRKTLLK